MSKLTDKTHKPTSFIESYISPKNSYGLINAVQNGEQNTVAIKPNINNLAVVPNLGGGGGMGNLLVGNGMMNKIAAPITMPITPRNHEVFEIDISRCSYDDRLARLSLINPNDYFPTHVYVIGKNSCVLFREHFISTTVVYHQYFSSTATMKNSAGVDIYFEMLV